MLVKGGTAGIDVSMYQTGNEFVDCNIAWTFRNAVYFALQLLWRRWWQIYWPKYEYYSAASNLIYTLYQNKIARVCMYVCMRVRVSVCMSACMCSIGAFENVILGA